MNTNERRKQRTTAAAWLVGEDTVSRWHSRYDTNHRKQQPGSEERSKGRIPGRKNSGYKCPEEDQPGTERSPAGLSTVDRSGERAEAQSRGSWSARTQDFTLCAKQSRRGFK